MLISYFYLHMLHDLYTFVCLCCVTCVHVTGFYHRSWNRLFRRIQQPISRKEEGRGEGQWRGGVCGVNYLCWQMFTDPNMHRSVDLAVPHSCQATFGFFWGGGSSFFS